MTHTKGPWIVCYNGNSLLSIASDSLKKKIISAPIKEDEGLYYQRGDQIALDFELMAAAPELLKACENALGAYDALKAIGTDKELPGYDHCLSFLNEAIRKAKGESSG